MKLLSVLLSTVLLLSLFPPLNASAEENTIESAYDGILIREGPGLSYPAIASGQAGEQFNELQRANGWVEVALNEGSGWIAEWLLVSSSEPTSEPSTVSEESNATILVDRLNVRDDFSLDGLVIGTLNTGDQVNVSDEKYGWLYISSDNISGWVSSDYVEYNSSSAVQTSEPATDDIHITVNTLNVRAEPDRNADVVGSVNLYDSFTVKEQSGEWLKIDFGDNTGWIASWFTERGFPPGGSTQQADGLDEMVTILYNGSNIRQEPSTDAAVVYKASAGEAMEIVGLSGDWYEIALPGGATGYIANWIVSTEGDSETAQEIEDTGEPEEPKEPVTSIADATIVIDAGHGGRDGGAVGAAGTLEKSLTIRTAEVLYHMLSRTGANVIMTREDDRYVDLYSRVTTSRDHQADVFISLHYDAINDRSVKGFTTYYYGGPDEDLADAVHAGLSGSMTVKNRGIQHGNFLVLRDNSAPSVLLELGFISNPSEEATINNDRFREMAATGIYNGLTEYFSQ